jgi:hypothetical protein
MASMVMAGISIVGTDASVLCELTGLSVEYVTKVTRRLRKSGVVRGQSLRVAWWQEKFAGDVAVVLDAGVAAGVFSRGINPKRSAAQKARQPETRARGPRQPRAKVEPGTVFVPQQKKSNPLYGLPEWETEKSK